MDWQDRAVVVIGAGRSGVAAAELLVRCGARVTLTDLRASADRAPLTALRQLGVEIVVGNHPPSLWQDADAVIVSPGISPHAAPVRAARERGLLLLSEIELAAPLAGAPAVAITGSNGKSTVTSMVGDILTAAGLEAPVCGNIGIPFSRVVRQRLDGSRRVDVFVLEMSSFQTETIRDFHPRWAAVLNISADHLDRHGELRSYAAAKLRLMHNMDDEDSVVYGADDSYLTSQMPITTARLVPFSAAHIESSGPAAWIEDGTIVWRGPDGLTNAVVATEEIPTVGAHNLLNAAAATAIACLAGATPENAAQALTSFAALEHRMERCGSVGGVDCVNDSKATNVGATLAALSGLDEDIWLILGGRDKGSDFNRLRDAVARRVRRVLLIGEASGKIAAALDGAVPLRRCGHLEQALDAALDHASPGDVVLLAPACTSFDQYDDYEQRGNHFKAIVAARMTGQASTVEPMERG